MTPRTYCIEVEGFDFDRVYIRAATRERARYLCARSYADAGHGDLADGFKLIKSCRLDPSGDDRRIVGERPGATEGMLECRDEDYPELRKEAEEQTVLSRVAAAIREGREFVEILPSDGIQSDARVELELTLPVCRLSNGARAIDLRGLGES